MITIQRLRRKLLVATSLLVAFYLLGFLFRQNFYSWIGISTASCKNQTLGFEKLMVVSTGPSWRTEGIIEAARFTDLSLAVPFQPAWSDEYVDDFRGFGKESRHSKISRGQAKCWLGHLNAIHEMLARNWSTALIMENDVDCDINIKAQLSRTARFIREVTNARRFGKWSPYGDTWDLLWLGHCGDAFPRTNVASFWDETLPPDSLYRENDGRYTKFPEQLRMVHISDGPFCIYAYALTASAASKISELSKHGMDKLITTHLREWCQGGILRCVTVNPELFHHHKKMGRISSEIAAVDRLEELAAPEHVEYTANIRYSARCNSRSEKLVSCREEFKETRIAR